MGTRRGERVPKTGAGRKTDPKSPRNAPNFPPKSPSNLSPPPQTRSPPLPRHPRPPPGESEPLFGECPAPNPLRPRPATSHAHKRDHAPLSPAPRRILGLCNNLPYVVMLSAARDLLEPRPVSGHAPFLGVGHAPFGAPRPPRKLPGFLKIFSDFFIGGGAAEPEPP